jgi:exopolysaccharide production protein ExoZ
MPELPGGTASETSSRGEIEAASHPARNSASAQVGATAPEPTPSASRPRWYPTLHVLRGVAAWSVVLLHASVIPGLPHDVVTAVGLDRIANLGFSGVYLFFVLSGFLMVHITQEDHGLLAAWRFLLARAQRTVPPYWAALCCAAAYYGTDPVASKELQLPPLSAEFLGRNMLTLDQHLLGVSWTLTFEWMFYAGFSLLVLLNLRAWWLVVPWAGWIYENRTIGVGPGSIAMSGLLIGAAVGEVALRMPSVLRAAKWAALITLVPIAVFATSYLWSLWRPALVLPLLLAPVVLAAIAFDQTHAPRYPRWLLLQGDYSYMIYLMHVPTLWALARLGR